MTSFWVTGKTMGDPVGEAIRHPPQSLVSTAETMRLVARNI
jgi:hypothetical protein